MYRFRYRYPMTELSFYEKIRLTNLYVKYWYLLQSKGRVLYFCYRPIKSYKEASEFQKSNIRTVWFYIITVPIMMFIEYALDEADAIKIGSFNLKILFRGYILSMTLMASLTLNSYARSFTDILPFAKFHNQIRSFVMMKVSDPHALPYNNRCSTISLKSSHGRLNLNSAHLTTSIHISWFLQQFFHDSSVFSSSFSKSLCS